MWAPWAQIAAGGLGVAWGLSGLTALKRRPPRCLFEAMSAVALIALGIALAISGAFRWQSD